MPASHPLELGSHHYSIELKEDNVLSLKLKRAATAQAPVALEVKKAEPVPAVEATRPLRFIPHPSASASEEPQAQANTTAEEQEKSTLDKFRAAAQAAALSVSLPKEKEPEPAASPAAEAVAAE